MSHPRELSFPKRALGFGVSLTLALFCTGGIAIWRLNHAFEHLTATLQVRGLTHEILQFDEVLTMSARMAAATGDLRWKRRYDAVAPKLDAAIEATKALAPQAQAVADAKATDEANRRLVAMEERAFRLVEAGDAAGASAIFASEDYEEQKHIYAGGMRAFKVAIEAAAERELAAQRMTAAVALAVTGILVVGLGLSWVFIVGLIRRYIDGQRQAESALLASNATLEERVSERTRLLAAANASLAAEMRSRLSVEAELRQAQKLEAVGRLAAGVAHEINTPVQFVNDSICFVGEAMKDLLGVIEKSQAVTERVLVGSLAQQEARAAQDAAEAADLADLTRSVPLAINRAAEGLSRIAAIVRSMKEFAHPDQKEMKPIDLNRAIQNTLVIARHEYKYVADLETHFAELPPVECHAGDLNQAILNIVVNAAHAIESAVGSSGQKGKISVSTSRDGNDVVIAITDTGTGISPDIQERIFDPFFTTKPVGKGTGQGLAIARTVVVDRHGGTLTLDSEVGKGTTFHLRVPIYQPLSRAEAQGAAA